MRSFTIALTLAVAASAVELESNAALNTELQAQANASMINDYLLAQVTRINTENDAAERVETVLAQSGESSTWGAYFGLW